ncbi:hypothetical protein A2841_00415 [Candidatus Kaiserbacteria bacterium RIFCSPHIGHO2_01_FULL_48_10]|uniref:Uncharacterized protein n=1 Tax=Candidatus Kaiserbacteria bacterium RIFCSPHIGHO2_01_FULL_48_10 TaxID=1798476 RepID=A0A1F6C5I7_9BACT|nr:MAG: hypothetical protein A2841_00415 [Candidatus Kaiserbacteria bacterium RIFCSPHIGHO2_01_FULL_48_10]
MNKEKRNAHSKAWRATHPGKVVEYRHKHKEKLAEEQRSNSPHLISALLHIPSIGRGHTVAENSSSSGHRVPRRRSSDDYMRSWGISEPHPERPLNFE